MDSLMTARLRIQGTVRDRSDYLIDAIGEAATGAVQGQAIFAFATVAGIDMLFSLDAVSTLANAGELNLLVGIDAVTNRAALERLLALMAKHKGFRARVFWTRGEGIFHPKVCYFRTSTRERWLIGSGNLTPRGLRDNCEMFADIEGASDQLKTLRKPLDAFLGANGQSIAEIDERALARAAKNRNTDPVSTVEPTQITREMLNRRSSERAERAARRRPARGDRVLVAELPRGGSRWQQANFNFQTVREYFDVDPEAIEEQQNIYLTEALPTGLSQNEEIRRFTFTRSRNLRLQLAAKSGLPYPTGGRPLLVMRELKPRHYVYHLLFPSDAGYRQCSNLLPQGNPGVRRAILSLASLLKNWHDSLVATI